MFLFALVADYGLFPDFKFILIVNRLFLKIFLLLYHITDKFSTQRRKKIDRLNFMLFWLLLCGFVNDCGFAICSLKCSKIQINTEISDVYADFSEEKSAFCGKIFLNKKQQKTRKLLTTKKIYIIMYI